MKTTRPPGNLSDAVRRSRANFLDCVFHFSIETGLIGRHFNFFNWSTEFVKLHEFGGPSEKNVSPQ